MGAGVGAGVERERRSGGHPFHNFQRERRGGGHPVHNFRKFLS